MKRQFKISILALSICLMLSACTTVNVPDAQTAFYSSISNNSQSFSIDEIPEFSDEPYVIINENEPDFDENDMTTISYENYGELDELDRCTSCMACIGIDLMPTEERGEIGSVKPTGWHTIKYDNVDGKYLYNRCHLIGYQLTAENANKQNLITGTRYLNVKGMLPFEDVVADYIKITKNHVLYRVTPIFFEDELVARGVQMEGFSVEDNGKGVCFNAYCYNTQPDIEIDYLTGESWSTITTSKDNGEKKTFVVNTNSKKFHTQECKFAKDIKQENKKIYNGTASSLIKNGYKPCQTCMPEK